MSGRCPERPDPRPIGPAAPALFHPDQAIDVDRLRQCASECVRSSSLIQRAAAGEIEAARALHIGFWPFVREFELAIDQHQLPRAPLRERFPERFNLVFAQMRRAVREMKNEEGSHAQHWQEAARDIQITSLDHVNISAVKELISLSYTEDMPEFFSVLAGTELIAEELSRFLVASHSFTALFISGRWLWGEIHLLPHDHGLSHLAIDLDLARAYSLTSDLGKVESAISATINLFGRAAMEVEREIAATKKLPAS